MPRDDIEEANRKVFVGGLDYETDDASLKNYFEQWGELSDFVVMKFPDTKRSRGFGFVTYRETDMLEECFSALPHTIDGKTVEIKRATPRDENRGSNARKGQFDNEIDPESKSMRKLFLGGLSYNSTEDTVKAHFEQYGELVDCVIMKFPDSGRSRGFGFVTFETSQQLDDCQNNRPHEIDGKTVETKRATPRSDAGKPEAQVSVKKVFIGGIPDEMEDDDIKDYFGEFGKVQMLSR